MIDICGFIIFIVFIVGVVDIGIIDKKEGKSLFLWYKRVKDFFV